MSAILQKSKTRAHFGLPFQESDTLEYLAGQFDSNVRELEGAIWRSITLIARVKKIKDITIIIAELLGLRKQTPARRTCYSN